MVQLLHMLKQPETIHGKLTLVVSPGGTADYKRHITPVWFMTLLVCVMFSATFRLCFLPLSANQWGGNPLKQCFVAGLTICIQRKGAPLKSILLFQSSIFIHLPQKNQHMQLVVLKQQHQNLTKHKWKDKNVRNEPGDVMKLNHKQAGGWRLGVLPNKDHQGNNNEAHVPEDVGYRALYSGGTDFLCMWVWSCLSCFKFIWCFPCWL